MAPKTENTPDNFIYLLTYLLEFVSGIFVYATVAQDNKRIRRHAIQAILLGIVSVIAYYLFLIIALGILSSVITLLIWLYCLYLGYEASKGNDVEVPILTSYVKSILK